MLNKKMEESMDILIQAYKTYGDGVVFLTSFSMEDNVITDLMSRAGTGIKHVTLDTGRLPQETYDMMEIISNRYGITPEIVFPRSDEVENMVRAHGINLFRSSPSLRELCCEVRKIIPLNRILSHRRAWISGIRSEQTLSRKQSEMVEPDPMRPGIMKFNPLLNWNSDHVKEYTEKFMLPINALYSRGYRSIGCAPCSRAVLPHESERSGRWWWEDSIKECGIHAPVRFKPVLREDE